LQYFPKQDTLVQSSWIPRDGLYPLSADDQEADIFLKPFMSGSLSFEEPINDPLYSSHKGYEKLDLATEKVTMRYQADHPSKAVACTQHVSQALGFT
jgi:hypothetical protein